MARCPRCGKKFKNDSRVFRHMAQTRSQCKTLIHRLIHLSHDLDLRPKRTHLHPTDPPLDSAPDIQVYDDAMDFAYSRIDIMEDLNFVPSVPVNAQSSTIEFFPAAAKVFEGGSTFMDNFYEDKHSQDRLDNVFYPFTSKEEWELASWLTRANISGRLMDEFFSLQLVRVHFYLMKNTHFISDTQPPTFFS